MEQINRYTKKAFNSKIRNKTGISVQILEINNRFKRISKNTNQ